MKIALKFNACLLALFMVSLGTTYLIARRLLEDNARNGVEENARIMMRSALAVRTYTSTQIQPLLNDRNRSEFLPQTVPS